MARVYIHHENGYVVDIIEDPTPNREIGHEFCLAWRAAISKYHDESLSWYLCQAYKGHSINNSAPKPDVYRSIT